MRECGWRGEPPTGPPSTRRSPAALGSARRRSAGSGHVPAKLSVRTRFERCNQSRLDSFVGVCLLPPPSDRSATASIPYFWGFSSSGAELSLPVSRCGNVAAVRRARARDEIVRLVHRTTGVHRLCPGHDADPEASGPVRRGRPADRRSGDPAAHQRSRSTHAWASVTASSSRHGHASSRSSYANRTSTSFTPWRGRVVAPPVSAMRLKAIFNRAFAIASSADRLVSTTSCASCAQTRRGPGAPLPWHVNPGDPVSKPRRSASLASLAPLLADGLRRAAILGDVATGDQRGTGVVVLAPDNSIDTATAGS